MSNLSKPAFSSICSPSHLRWWQPHISSCSRQRGGAVLSTLFPTHYIQFINKLRWFYFWILSPLTAPPPPCQDYFNSQTGFPTSLWPLQSIINLEYRVNLSKPNTNHIIHLLGTLTSFSVSLRIKGGVKPGVLVHTPRILEAEGRVLEVQGQPQLYRKVKISLSYVRPWL